MRPRRESFETCQAPRLKASAAPAPGRPPPPLLHVTKLPRILDTSLLTQPGAVYCPLSTRSFLPAVAKHFFCEVFEALTLKMNLQTRLFSS